MGWPEKQPATYYLAIVYARTKFLRHDSKVVRLLLRCHRNKHWHLAPYGVGCRAVTGLAPRALYMADIISYEILTFLIHKDDFTQSGIIGEHFKQIYIEKYFPKN